MGDKGDRDNIQRYAERIKQLEGQRDLWFHRYEGANKKLVELDTQAKKLVKAGEGQVRDLLLARESADRQRSKAAELEIENGRVQRDFENIRDLLRTAEDKLALINIMIKEWEDVHLCDSSAVRSYWDKVRRIVANERDEAL